MTVLALVSILSAGLAMGILHAFDADHLTTISSLSARPDARQATMHYAFNWAAGHAGILVIAAVLLLFYTLPLPPALSAGAERLVGIILLAAGGTLAHALLHDRAAMVQPSALRQRAPFLIGMVHGCAGSAAALALLPMGLLTPATGLIYVVLFSIGVLAGMMGFGLAFERARQALEEKAGAILKALRGAIAALAMAMGAYWLLGA